MKASIIALALLITLSMVGSALAYEVNLEFEQSSGSLLVTDQFGKKINKSNITLDYISKMQNTISKLTDDVRNLQMQVKELERRLQALERKK